MPLPLLHRQCVTCRARPNGVDSWTGDLLEVAAGDCSLNGFDDGWHGNVGSSHPYLVTVAAVDT